MKLSVAKSVAFLSRGIFLYLPSVYLKVYSIYKRLTDSYKHNIIKRIVVSGDYVIDIGAHIGYYSFALAELVG